MVRDDSEWILGRVCEKFATKPRSLVFEGLRIHEDFEGGPTK